MAGQDYDDQQLRIERKLTENHQIKTNLVIRQAASDERRDILERQLLETREEHRKLMEERKQTFWGSVKKIVVQKIGEVQNYFDKVNNTNQNVGNDENRENDTNNQPEIVNNEGNDNKNVTGRLSKIGDDHVKFREKLFSKTKKPPKNEKQIFTFNNGGLEINNDDGNVNINKEETSKQNKNNKEENKSRSIGDGSGNIFVNKNSNAQRIEADLDEQREADIAEEQKVKDDEEFNDHLETEINIMRAENEKMKKDQNEPGIFTNICDGVKNYPNICFNYAKTCYDKIKKLFSKETLFMGLRQRIWHRFPKNEEDNDKTDNDNNKDGSNGFKDAVIKAVIGAIDKASKAVTEAVEKVCDVVISIDVGVKNVVSSGCKKIKGWFSSWFS
uniref:Uncharacterized protein n=1 Tax=Meloidogyne hapla TaxID=6305 RepID=A0A1I8B9D3_MELHA